MDANANQHHHDQQQKRKSYPLAASDYRLGKEIGHGVGATVYEAWCIPMEETVAIKSIDLDRLNANLDDIRREAQTMSLIDHPNVLRAHCSFTVDHHLWVVMPFMAAGSCQSIMKTSFPDGFDEPIIGLILNHALRALEYLHHHGHIHRDIKAGNILIDQRGAVKVADFGVSACVFESGDRHRHNTFVGTPCWMAPEVIENGNGYDHKADIWSFGITALELAHGHAPFSKLPPMKALLMQLQGAPPRLDKKFSRAFREMVGLCLVKDPSRRPSADRLLKHSFFRHAKSADYIVKHVLENLPGLAERVRMVRESETLKVQQKHQHDEEEEEDEGVGMPHLRRISGWNFNENNLKFEPVYPHVEENQDQNQVIDPVFADPVASSLEPNTKSDGSHPGRNSDAEMNLSSDSESTAGEESKGLCDFSESGHPEAPASEEQCPRESSPGLVPSETHLEEKHPLQTAMDLANKTANETEVMGQGGQGLKPSIIHKKGRFSVTEEDVGALPNKAVLHPLPPLRRMHSLSSQPSLSSVAASAGLVVSPKVPTSPREVSSHTMPLSALLPQMQNILQSTLSQQETILQLLNNLGVGPDHMGLTSMNSVSAQVRHKSAIERESELMQQLAHLQDRLSGLQVEVHAIKAKNEQLEHLWNNIHNKEEKEELNREEAEEIQIG